MQLALENVFRFLEKIGVVSLSRIESDGIRLFVEHKGPEYWQRLIESDFIRTTLFEDWAQTEYDFNVGQRIRDLETQGNKSKEAIEQAVLELNSLRESSHRP